MGILAWLGSLRHPKSRDAADAATPPPPPPPPPPAHPQQPHHAASVRSGTRRRLHPVGKPHTPPLPPPASRLPFQASSGKRPRTPPFQPRSPSSSPAPAPQQHYLLQTPRDEPREYSVRRATTSRRRLRPMGYDEAFSPPRPSQDPTRDRSPRKGAAPDAVPQNIYDRAWHRDPYAGKHSETPWDSVHALPDRDHRGGLGGYDRMHSPTPYLHPVPELPPELARVLEGMHEVGLEWQDEEGHNAAYVAQAASEQRRRLASGGGAGRSDGAVGGGLRDCVAPVDELVDQLVLGFFEDEEGEEHVAVAADFLTTDVAAETQRRTGRGAAHPGTPPAGLGSVGGLSGGGGGGGVGGGDGGVVGDTEFPEIFSDESSEPEVEEDGVITGRQYHHALMIFREQMAHYRQRHPEEYPRYLEKVMASGLPREDHEHYRREQAEFRRNNGEAPEYTRRKERDALKRQIQTERPFACPASEADPDSTDCRKRFKTGAEAQAHFEEVHPDMARKARKKKSVGGGGGGGGGGKKKEKEAAGKKSKGKPTPKKEKEKKAPAKDKKKASAAKKKKSAKK
eukprot:Rhum_TRINITY_DN11380_c1_g1::Rhum_TRINITY_DN11380_c1_g1_i1::g.44271::m.44271